MNAEPTNLEQLLYQIDKAAGDNDRVTLNTVIEALGRRSFGPLLLLAGLIILAPLIGNIPGMPTIAGMLVFLTAGQLLFHRKHFWLPGWMLNRAVGRDKLHKSLSRLRPASRFADHLLRSRLSALTQGTGLYLTAIACMVITTFIPVMEFIPFGAKLAGVALTVFGLSLIARDGVMVLLALLFTAATIGITVYYLL